MAGEEVSMVNYEDHIVKPEESYRGMSYGDWVARWTNWLFSDDPDSAELQGDVLFLRGNLKYSQDLELAERVGLLGTGQQSVDPWASFYNRTGEDGIVVSAGTAILVPVITSTEFFGGVSELGTMTTEEQVRNIARIATDESGAIWAAIESADRKGRSALSKEIPLTRYRITSPVFKLRVSDRNPYWKNILQDPLNAGEYDAVTDGFFILLRDLPPGSYRVQFGGKGRLNYRTDSVYDIYITAAFARKSTVTDISSGKTEDYVWKAREEIPERNLPILKKGPKS